MTCGKFRLVEIHIWLVELMYSTVFKLGEATVAEIVIDLIVIL